MTNGDVKNLNSKPDLPRKCNIRSAKSPTCRGTFTYVVSRMARAMNTDISLASGNFLIYTNLSDIHNYGIRKPV